MVAEQPGRQLPSLFALAFPSIVANLLYSGVAIVQLKFVGTLGPEALAAIGVGQRVFFALQAVLMAAGASMDDVVKLNIYLTGEAELAKVREVRQRYFTGEFPAATGVFVAALADPEFLIEIDAIAVTG